MRHWTPEQVARAAGARLVGPPPTSTGPERVTIDSRDADAGVLFVGLAGASAHGGSFAQNALASGAWGALTTEEYAERATGAAPGVLLAAEDPLKALQSLARAWRDELNASVIGVTGSTGKTTTKDMLLALLTPRRRTVASRKNYNTEIGLPLEILGAPAETEVLVLEMAMRGAGQIAELAAIARPDVGVIVSIGPVHLELLQTIEAIAAAKAELIEGLEPGASAIVPADEPLLAPNLRTDVETITFGDGGEVSYATQDDDHVEIDVRGHRIGLELQFTQPHLRRNLLAAVAAAQAIGVTPAGRLEFRPAPGRGAHAALPSGITLIDDCYNANPMSMLAALEDLAATADRIGARRRVAVLGDMLELGPEERAFHQRLGEQAGESGIDVVIAVGPLAAAIADRFRGEIHLAADAGEAAALLPDLVEPGDVVLVKASRGVGLEVVCEALHTQVPA